MQIQTVVQHHPARDHLLPALLAALPAGATVVSDPDPGSPRRSPWRTYLACLQTLEPAADSLLIVQDDVEPCRDFAKAVALVARSCRNAPTVLFCPGVGLLNRAILNGCAAGERYIQLPAHSFVPCVAVLWPASTVASILEWAGRAGLPPEMTADDGILGRWMQATRTEILATVPSLVEHPDRERSLIGRHSMGGKNPARIAACWLGDMSALELDW